MHCSNPFQDAETKAKRRVLSIGTGASAYGIPGGTGIHESTQHLLDSSKMPRTKSQVSCDISTNITGTPSFRKGKRGNALRYGEVLDTEATESFTAGIDVVKEATEISTGAGVVGTAVPSISEVSK